METTKSDVYGISGMFIEGHTRGKAQFFGGFFATRPAGDTTEISGGLVDIYGTSDIEGQLHDAELQFMKLYRRRNDSIEYRFKKKDNGLWVGEYAGSSAIGKGYAVAKTHLDWPQVNMILPEPFNPERWAKSMLEQMVEEGSLKIVKDKTTGEECVKLGKRPQ